MMEQKDKNKERSCLKKHPYRSSFFAFMMAQQVQRHTGAKMDYYRCRFCGKYHVGHV